jgi:guanylate kinase
VSRLATDPQALPRAGNVIVISAPSGTGKTTVVKRVLASVAGLGFSVSHTTRPRRPGERHGREYFFVSRAHFQRMVAADEFAEWAEVHGNFYGTSWKALQNARARGKDAVLDIDVQGHGQVRRRLPDALSIFLLPPSLAELARRLRRRHSDAPEVIDNRLRAARQEIEHWSEYDYLVVNDRVSAAVRAVEMIVLAARLRRQNQHNLVEHIFAGLLEGRTNGFASRH